MHARVSRVEKKRERGGGQERERERERKKLIVSRSSVAASVRLLAYQGLNVLVFFLSFFSSLFLPFIASFENGENENNRDETFDLTNLTLN